MTVGAHRGASSCACWSSYPDGTFFTNSGEHLAKSRGVPLVGLLHQALLHRRQCRQENPEATTGSPCLPGAWRHDTNSAAVLADIAGIYDSARGLGAA